jgi:hypothetical protein
METQLVNRYLYENVCHHGLYLIGWFNSALSENWITLACQGREAFGQLDDFSWQMPLSGNGR